MKLPRPFGRRLIAGALLALLAFPVSASAHFIWVKLDPTGSDGPVVHLRLAEEADVNEPQLLGRLEGISVRRFDADGTVTPLVPKLQYDQLSAPLRGSCDSIVLARHPLGVMEREGNRFRLDYIAKTGPSVDSELWSNLNLAEEAVLDVVPRREGDSIVLQVRFRGEPAVGCTVNVLDGGGFEAAGETDASGNFSFVPEAQGLASIRVRHIETKAGEVNGQAYDEIRTYSTLALPIGPASATGDRTATVLPQLVTSFGAAMVDGRIYVYGGHTGNAHDYSDVDQDNIVRCLDLNAGEGAEWKSLGEGPRLQGLALVPHGSSVIRVGGFHARNEPGEDHDLWSTAEVARFDVESGAWQALPDLPEPRSSHDAIVLAGKLYVVGGWAMAGEGDTTWHSTGWSLDLNDSDAKWEKLPEVPFRRRALALAAHGDRLYAIGGMQETGGPSTRVDRFDPASGTWEEVASLNGVGMAGFGCAAFATGGKLYVSTVQGELQRLSEDDSSWEVVRKLPTSRFFHRMLPLDERHLVIVGGGHMEEGKFDRIDVIDVEATSTEAEE